MQVQIQRPNKPHTWEQALEFCSVCSNRFIQDQLTGRPRKYCSDKCRQLASLAKRNGKAIIKTIILFDMEARQ